MELKTENDGTKNRERWNQKQQTTEPKRRGERTLAGGRKNVEEKEKTYLLAIG